MQTKDPKPEIMRLEELALMVKSGEIKLPKFQRPFVWKAPDMLKLLDSIYKGYPIGSILIWNSSQKLTSERNISGFSVNTSNQNNYPTNYLLDGQQRLTTLCGALFWDGIDQDSLWNIHFDLDAEEFRHPRDKDLVNVFPLNKLIDTSDFIRQCMKFDHHEKRVTYFKNAERLLKSIKDYKIAVVKIGDMTIEEVAPIFERINSTGRQLTIVDLMMAATWSNGFDLTSEIQAIKGICEEIGFEDVDDQVVLRTISASAGLGVNKDDIQKLRTKNHVELKEAAAKASDSIYKALSFLKERIGIHDVSYIPYGIQLTYIAEFFRISANPSEIALSQVARWFWYTSATRYFGSSSSTGQVTKDLSLFRAFATGKEQKLFDVKEIDISRLLFDKFNLRTAASTAFVLLLNNANPKSTIDGQTIDRGHLTLKSAKFFSSFSPKNGSVERRNIAKIIYPAGRYVDGIESLLELQDLSANLLSSKCVEAKQKENVQEFLNERARIISLVIESLTDCPVRWTLPIEENTAEFLVDEDEEIL